MFLSVLSLFRGKYFIFSLPRGKNEKKRERGKIWGVKELRKKRGKRIGKQNVGRNGVRSGKS